jgi:hypothetical protein
MAWARDAGNPSVAGSVVQEMSTIGSLADLTKRTSEVAMFARNRYSGMAQNEIVPRLKE